MATDVVLILFSNRPIDFCSTHRGGRTSLHHAAYNGHYEMTNLLVSQPGCVVNACDKKDRRALHYAAHMGHDAIVKLLVDNSAAVDVKV